MHVYGRMMFSGNNEDYFGDVMVADVFSENNEIKMMVSLNMDIDGDLPKDLNEIDTLVFNILILDYNMLIVSKDLTLDVDYFDDYGNVRMYIGIDYYDSQTAMVTQENKELCNNDKERVPDLDDYVNRYLEKARFERQFEEGS